MPEHNLQSWIIILGSYRKHPQTKDGTPRIKAQFTKITQHWAVKDIRERKDKKYLAEIMMEEIKNPSDEEIRRNRKLELIPENIVPMENLGMCELVKLRKSKFNK